MVHGYVPPGQLMFFDTFCLLGVSRSKRVHLLILIIF